MLTLPIKRKWFTMIRAGDKKEEYRDNTPYYRARFFDHIGEEMDVILRNGYAASSPSMRCRVLVDFGNGRPDWGAIPGREYFILKILEHEDVVPEIFVLKARRCKRCGGLLTSKKAVKNGFGHVCYIKHKAEKEEKERQISLFGDE